MISNLDRKTFATKIKLIFFRKNVFDVRLKKIECSWYHCGRIRHYIRELSQICRLRSKIQFLKYISLQHKWKEIQVHEFKAAKRNGLDGITTKVEAYDQHYSMQPSPLPATQLIAFRGSIFSMYIFALI